MGGGVTDFWGYTRENCRIKNSYVLAAFGEFWGTFILGLFAVGAGAQNAILCMQTEGAGCHSIIPMVGGVLGLMIAITIFGGISGAHINPAVTLGLAVSGKIGWAKLPLYWSMQFLGAYLGSGLAYGLYVGQLENLYKGSVTENPGASAIFAPLPHDRVGLAFADQVIGTAILVMIIHSALDPRNMKVPTFYYGALFASTIAGINLALGYHGGGVLNPARDISARLMAVTVGFDSSGVFSPATEDSLYWLAPLFGPLVGGVIGAFMYVMFVGGHLKENGEGEEDKVSLQGQSNWTNQNNGRPMQHQQYMGQSPPPPPPQPQQKKEKKKGFGWKDAMKVGKLAQKGLDAAQDFDPSALEDIDMEQVGDMAMKAAEKGHDMYQKHQAQQQQRQSQQPQQQYQPPQQQQFGNQQPYNNGGMRNSGYQPPPPPPQGQRFQAQGRSGNYGYGPPQW